MNFQPPTLNFECLPFVGAEQWKEIVPNQRRAGQGHAIMPPEASLPPMLKHLTFENFLLMAGAIIVARVVATGLKLGFTRLELMRSVFAEGILVVMLGILLGLLGGVALSQTITAAANSLTGYRVAPTFPLDLIILPARSSAMPQARNVRMWAALHPSLILEKRVLRAVAATLRQ